METGGELVAQIGPVSITTQELEKRIAQQSPFVKVQLKDPKKLRKFIEDELRQEVLVQEGWKRGLSEDPQIKEALKKAIIQRVMREYLTSLGDSIKVTQADLLNAYKARHAEFNKPEKIRLSQIVRYVKSPKERTAARRLLESIKKKVIAGQKKNNHKAFAEAAAEQSQDAATKKGGGDLQFLTRPLLEERYGAEVAKYMFEDVKIGDLAVADAPNAVVLFKKTGRRRATTRTLEQVKPQLRSQLLGEKRTKAFSDFVESLKKKHGVVFRDNVIDQIKLPQATKPTVPTRPQLPKRKGSP